jgi:hypothetical protein
MLVPGTRNYQVNQGLINKIKGLRYRRPTKFKKKITKFYLFFTTKSRHNPVIIPVTTCRRESWRVLGQEEMGGKRLLI